MNASSPTKRRVLGALDPNACSPNKARRHEGNNKLLSFAPQYTSPVKAKPVAPRQALTTITSPSRLPSLSASPSGTPEREEGTKSRKRRSPSPATVDPVPEIAATRALEEAAEGGERAAKRACLDGAREDGRSPPSSTSTARTVGSTRPRSASPDTPSVFDNSAVDNSQVTILTEPDATGPAPAPGLAAAPLPAPRTRPRLTREQAREKAEILRLRLGLASYKVRTGQTDVPLDRLEARLAGGMRHARGFSSSSFHGRPGSQDRSVYYRPTSVSASFPPLAATISTAASTAAVGRGHRRPLPGAPTRRASVVGLERGDHTRAAAPSRSELLEEVRSAIARGDEQRRNHYQHQSHPHYHQHQQKQPYQYHHRRHYRRQSEAMLDTRNDPRRYMHSTSTGFGIPPLRRPRTATDAADFSLSRSSSSSWASSMSASASRRRAASFAGNSGYYYHHHHRQVEEEEEDEDMESRGGAASGLLSLARS
ncbi:hypothetical protein C7999DRAFT_17542 [Corynascus novoguineensis]|uniref:Cyclin-dependent kinase n=1 Tax=Corynascus novoguineensis TaxID=1126955 RepID=A0AAN7HJB6_9PEZI|nr:hypothetical protein C7999DRAFT_17542 [Corynascus novoguineensis]